MRSVIINLLVALPLALAAACGSGDSDPYDSGGSESTADDDASSKKRSKEFAAVQELVSSRCASCHGGGQSPSLSGHAQLAANAEAMLAAVEQNRMPPGGGISPDAAVTLRGWIEAGMPN
jgi:uncharacterized membrane protein